MVSRPDALLDANHPHLAGLGTGTELSWLALHAAGEGGLRNG